MGHYRYLALLALLAGCADAAGSSERVGERAQGLSGAAITIDPRPLAPGARVTLRVHGSNGFDAVVGFLGTTLPPLADAVYTITDYDLRATYGTFTVSGGNVVATTGALTIAASGIGFDLTALAAVKIPSSSLTEPAGLFSVRVVNIGVFGRDPTYYLPDGEYGITDYDVSHSFGTFRVSGRTVVSTTGTLAVAPDGIAFDRTKLARVPITGAPLSEPAGMTIYRFGTLSGNIGGNVVVYLPSGSWRITDYAGIKSFGSFSIAGSTVTGASSPMVTTGNTISWDTTKLASVRVPESMLTIPSGAMVVTLVSAPGAGYSAAFARDVRFFVPDGDYTVADGNAEHTFGAFSVRERAVVSTSGAVSAAADGITFDLDELARVRLPMPDMSTPRGLQSARLNGLAFWNAGTADTTYFFAPGSYSVSNPGFDHGYGSFFVNGSQVASASGGLTLDTNGVLQANRCALVGVDIVAQPGKLARVFNVTSTFSSATLSLPPGTYLWADAGPSFTLRADGSITYDTLPSNVASIRPHPCVEPPKTTCVGTPTSPVVLPDACSSIVDNTNQLAGSCSGGGGGLASCTFDSSASRTLAAGDHAVTVVGTAIDGSQSTCTSYVRVAPCPVPPTVTCVGTADAPARVATAPATCGRTIDAVNALAGTCVDAGSGLSSCTFDGAASRTLAPGSYAIEVKGASAEGAAATCTSYVRVVDEEAPTISCGSSRVVECTGALTSVSSTATCADNCGTCISTCASSSAAVGPTAIACVAEDASGITATCDAAVEVVDTIAPSVAMTVSPTVLWPPKHQLVPINVVTQASDRCDAAPVVVCSASSNEAPLATGSGHTDPDVVWSGGQLFLRAERSGRTTDRVYTITCTARDASGNTATTNAFVTVPHDR